MKDFDDLTPFPLYKVVVEYSVSGCKDEYVGEQRTFVCASMAMLRDHLNLSRGEGKWEIVSISYEEEAPV